jgi:hypothetical protein
VDSLGDFLQRPRIGVHADIELLRMPAGRFHDEAAVAGSEIDRHSVVGVDQLLELVPVELSVGSAADQGQHGKLLLNTGSLYCRGTLPSVINGFSDLILELYGPEVGAHARSAVGLAELPFDMPVEIEAEVEIKG